MEFDLEKELERNFNLIMNPNFWDKYPAHLREKELKKRDILSKLFWKEIKNREKTEEFYLKEKLIKEDVVKCKTCGVYYIIVPLFSLNDFSDIDNGLCNKCMVNISKNNFQKKT